MKFKYGRTAIRAFCGIIVAGSTTLAVAQEGGDVVEEIVVTGSRIAAPNLVTNSPVTQVTNEEITLQGTVRVEDMLRTLPQIYQNQGTGQSNGATGTATLNLRNLGDERTLVLVDGRRLPAGSPISGGIGADINQIPAALIERIEVLTGGASATYGSDAVAGVVNFIMKDDFQGIQLDAQFSGYNHSNDDSRMQDIVTSSGYEVATGTKTDGEAKDFSLIMGGNLADGRGNVTSYVTYRDIKPVTQGERDYSSCSLNGAANDCVGSSTIPTSRFLALNGDFDYTVQGTDFVDRAGRTFNFGPFNYYQRPDERWTAGVFANYDMTDTVESYAKAMFTDDRTLSQIAPSGNFAHTTFLNCGNPLLSDQQFQAACGDFGLTRADTRDDVLHLRRNVEGGNRQQDLRHTTFRGVLGFRGEINDTWNFDVSGQFAEVSMENTYLNDLSITRLSRALDVIEDPSTGEPACRSAVEGFDSDCVPWNVFSTAADAITPEVLNYMTLPLFARGTTEQTVLTGYVSGNLGDYGIKLPSAENAVDLVVGVEQRDESLEFSPDFGFQTGDGSGQGGATGPINGSYDVTELFLETSIPLVENAPLAQQIDLNIGYRYSDYSTGVTTDTYGIRAGWVVNNDIKARISFQRAVRAANIQELFLPQGFNLFDQDTDPCGGPVDANGMTEAGRTFEECARSGVTQAQFGNIQNNPAGQYNFLQGGNPDLDPEEADTFSVGLVWTPEFASGLSLSVDYYDIEIVNGIATPSADFILNECLDGNLSQCDRVNRHATRGDLWIGSDVNSSGHVVATMDNLAVEAVQGLDIVVDYTMGIGDMGSLSFNNVLGMILTWDQQEIASAPAVDCKGNWGASCGFPTPDLQNNLRVTWDTPWDINASALWRHISKVNDLASSDVDLAAADYLDLAGVWNVSETLTTRLGINNVLDRDPPIGGNNAGPSIQGNGNIFPGMYDALGRYIFVGISLKM